MFRVTVALLACLSLAFGGYSPTLKGVRNITDVLPEIEFDVDELIKYYGYEEENHEVQTEDGYLLTLNRILPKSNGKSTKGSVLLVPGLVCNAPTFVFNREQSLGFYLADAGYDVWLMNYRGTTYSRKHISLDPEEDKAKFFSYSYHEIGYYDTAAAIDYILEKTDEKSLFYVGHSQGTTSFFAMASSRPEYNEKIRLSVALAPVGYIEHISQPILRFFAENINLLKYILQGIQFYELAPHWDVFTDIGIEFCNDDSELQDLCAQVLFLFGGTDEDQLNKTLIPLYSRHIPAGVTKKQLIHYQQGIVEGTFRQYNYGVLGNLLHYGEIEPPKYDLSQITAPVALFYAQNDFFANLDDVGRLIRELPNLVHTHRVDFENFTHLDFIIAMEANKYVNEPVLKLMEEY